VFLVFRVRLKSLVMIRKSSGYERDLYTWASGNYKSAVDDLGRS
jgi:hypothetical protein